MPDYLIPSFAAGFLYIISPGPVFIGMLALVSFRGRIDGLKLAGGSFIGDVCWLLLTYGFLIGSSLVPPLFTIILNFLCGAYLLYIAYKMLRSLKQEAGGAAFTNPFRDGLTLGLLNPKSYPVAISLFSSLMNDYQDSLTLDALPLLMLSAGLGMIAAYLIEIFLAGITHFRAFYKNHWKTFTAFFAVVFVFLGLKLWWDAAAGMM